MHGCPYSAYIAVLYIHVYLQYIHFCACHLRWYLHLLFIVHMLRLSICSA